MPGKTLEIETLITPDGEATEIARKWREWVIYRDKKVEEWKELRNYLFATDTRTTSNNRLPWSNSTTTPKLTQIRDNLHANYFAAIFPNQKWMKWQADDKDANVKRKKDIIQGYVQTKIEQSGFVDTASRLILDWIDTGNCFATVDHVVDFVQAGDNDLITKYTGPKLRRISPYDIVFNPTVDSFENTPKIIKELVTAGDLKKRIQQNPEDGWLQDAFDQMLQDRVNALSTAQDSELTKTDGFIADGFGSITQYYESDYVELLHFIGDMYNSATGEIQLNRIITVGDRQKVLRNITNPSWLGASVIRHSGWRQRPDNLYGMGPLENLVGLQYRIDHLENMKADIWDQVAYPVLKIAGDVQEFEFEPGARIYLGEEGDVQYLAPDVTALAADQQIADLANKMEELAGAPRMAMGIRTPGEKTAFEVGVLDRGAARVFQHKAYHWERSFLEPLMNDMLEVGRRNLDVSELVRVLSDESDMVIFENITREDITARGKLRPMGSRHFAERALRLQNLQNLWQLKLQDPTVGVHISGKEVARILSEELDEPTVFNENVAVMEQMETQSLASEAEVFQQEQEMTAIEEGV